MTLHNCVAINVALVMTCIYQTWACIYVLSPAIPPTGVSDDSDEKHTGILAIAVTVMVLMVICGAVSFVYWKRHMVSCTCRHALCQGVCVCMCVCVRARVCVQCVCACMCVCIYMTLAGAALLSSIQYMPVCQVLNTVVLDCSHFAIQPHILQM